MSVELAVTDYNLTLLPQPSAAGAAVELGAEQLAQIMHDPIMSIDAERVVSVRDQLSVVIRPPSVAIVDHKGVAPARAGMVKATSAVVQMFLHQGFTPQPYGWNVQGVVVGVAPVEVMGRLTNASVVSDRLSDAGTTWSASQLTLSMEVKPGKIDRLNLTLGVRDEPNGKEELVFNANAHHQQAPDLDHLQDEGARMWAATSEIIRRLAI